MKEQVIQWLEDEMWYPSGRGTTIEEVNTANHLNIILQNIIIRFKKQFDA